MSTTSAAGPVPEANEYLLGTDAAELERLRFQHFVWRAQELELLARGGVRAGQRVLDLGCGPGFTTLELAQQVGPTGHVLASDQSERFLVVLRRECAQLGVTCVEPRLGPVEELVLEPGSLDAAYARWLFCWLPDPLAVLRRVAHALRPGGVVLLQEYLDWGAMGFVPRGPAFARAVDACMENWRRSGARIDLAAEIPDLAPAAGLVVEHLAPRARLGGVGSPEWRWIGGFLRTWLPKVAAQGLLAPHELEAWRAEWDAREAEGSCHLATPTMADVVLRKPGG